MVELGAPVTVRAIDHGEHGGCEHRVDHGSSGDRKLRADGNHRPFFGP
jgi:hypothetical protein